MNALYRRWDRALYAVACDIEANHHYNDNDDLMFQCRLFLREFFKRN